jgi:hypothetical protein
MAFMKIDADFFALAKDGKTASEIARSLRRDIHTVQAWARAAGVVLADGSPGRARGEEMRKLIELNEGLPLGAPRSRYAQFNLQKKSATKRGIGWELTFVEWIRLWDESGKWELRGPLKGQYCMGRNGDVGPYKVGNVRIISVDQNIAELTINKGQPNNVGTGRGWRYFHGRTLPYYAQFRGKYLGYFATPDEAHSAYRAAHEKYQQARAA